ncbi:MAG: tetraacyldisaccharide 4'-kinase [Pseudomonadota bacterium]
MRAPDFWARDGLIPGLLSPLGAGYGWIAERRRRAQQARSVSVPVICIGNLVAGGAGKTPVTLDILTRLKKRGVAAHALTRGYGGGEGGPLLVDPARHSYREVGDEALLLARTAPTWVARDRIAGAEAAIQEGAEVLVMDDGFQNGRLKKDLSLLVFDGPFGMGNGRLLPAGPLRESLASGMARADGAVIIGKDDHDLADRLGGKLPLLRAEMLPLDDTAKLAGKRLVAFAGIGRPQKFFDSLAATGAELAATHAFADHHPFQPDEILALEAQARDLDADLMTTAKDWIRLPNAENSSIRVFPIGLSWRKPDILDQLLNRLIPHGQETA